MSYYYKHILNKPYVLTTSYLKINSNKKYFE